MPANASAPAAAPRGPCGNSMPKRSRMRCVNVARRPLRTRTVAMASSSRAATRTPRYGALEKASPAKAECAVRVSSVMGHHSFAESENQCYGARSAVQPRAFGIKEDGSGDLDFRIAPACGAVGADALAQTLPAAHQESQSDPVPEHR